jgi:hypothetical protein
MSMASRIAKLVTGFWGVTCRPACMQIISAH